MKPIPNFPGYFADELGNIFSARPERNRARPPILPRKLAPCLRGHGTRKYRYVHLYRGSQPTKKNISALVLETFVGERPIGAQVCHGAGGSLDDSLVNLRWGTPKENAFDRDYRDKTQTVGELHPAHKLNSVQVRIIRQAYQLGKGTGISQRYLAKVFLVDQTKISQIILRKSWKHI